VIHHNLSVSRPSRENGDTYDAEHPQITSCSADEMSRMTKSINISVGNYVLIDGCRYSNGHPQAWLIGVVERELEPRRYLIRYLHPSEDGLSFRIHTPRSMRAVGDKAHVRRVHAGVLEHLQQFDKERKEIDKAGCANRKKWDAYIMADDKIKDRHLALYQKERAALDALHQPGLIRWNRNGGMKIDIVRKRRRDAAV
jgi:hypothetical protein